MKPVSITCIVCGTLIFVAPMLYLGGTFALCAYALANTHLSPMNITAPPLGEGYQAVSMFFGIVLTLVGIGFALLGRRPARAEAASGNAAVLAQPDNA